MRDELMTLINSVDAVAWETSGPDIERFEPCSLDALPEPVRSFIIAGAKSLGCTG